MKNGSLKYLWAQAAASREFDKLLGPAHDDPMAREKLHELLVSQISDFCDLVAADPEKFRDLAKRNQFWPGLLSCWREGEKRNAATIKMLSLGENCGWQTRGRKQFSTDAVENRIALNLCAVLKAELAARKRYVRKKHGPSYAHAASLKPFSRATWQQWFKAAWPMFIARYGQDFENHKAFRGYWQNIAFREEPIHQAGRDGTTSARELQLKRTARALIRDAVKKTLKQSFRTIAPSVE